jgi:hypothetical protein
VNLSQVIHTAVCSDCAQLAAHRKVLRAALCQALRPSSKAPWNGPLRLLWPWRNLHWALLPAKSRANGARACFRLGRHVQFWFYQMIAGSVEWVWSVNLTLSISNSHTAMAAASSRPCELCPANLQGSTHTQAGQIINATLSHQ